MDTTRPTNNRICNSESVLGGAYAGRAEALAKEGAKRLSIS